MASGIEYDALNRLVKPLPKSKPNKCQSHRLSLILRCLVVEQMGNDDSCVVNYLLFLHPPGIGLLHKAIHCFRRSRSGEKKIDGLIVINKFPKPIRCDNDDSVRRGVQLFLSEFWIRNDTSGMGDRIPKRSRHGQSRHIHVTKPNARRAINSVIVLHGKHPPPRGNNSLLLPRGIGLVIVSEFLRRQLPTLLKTQNDAGIPNVNPNQLIPPDDCHRQRRATELSINSEIADNLMFHLSYCVGGGLFDVGCPAGVGHHFHGELVTELSRDTVTVFPVSVEDAEDESVCGGIVGHDEGILVLFAGIVRGVTLL
mmetsp:Transcript_3816/g.7228  ORF Transcript_3816/g.7228 Transcript_3816/m.7228 type:complete len:311 (-) Transcript_3816:343-1275(-)